MEQHIEPKQKKSFSIVALTLALVIGISIGQFGLARYWMPPHEHDVQHMHEMMDGESKGEVVMEHHDMSEQRLAFVDQKQRIQNKLLHDGKYSCCLEKPCTYCIEKTPGHGEGATCSCLDDIMNGRHPCGECIGEILEGHGNKYLKDYFAPAIAEEVGMEHLETVQKIIDEKYMDA